MHKRGLIDPTADIREAIVAGRYFPNERLVEEDLVRAFSANRGAIRLALARLEQEGLVTREPNRGARVRVISGEEALQIAETRSLLEALIARHAARNATEADIDELREFLRDLERLRLDGDLDAFSRLNIRFHDAVVRVARHETAAKVLSSLNSQSVTFIFRPLLEPGRVVEIRDEHERLVDAIAAGDAVAAERAMRDHLDNALPALQRAIARRREPSP